MSNGGANDWEPPQSDAPDSSPEPSGENAPPPTSAPPSREERQPPPSTPSIDKAVQTMKTLVERVLDGQVVMAYLALFAVWMLLSGLFVGGAVAAIFAAGLIGSSSPELAGWTIAVLLGGTFLIAFLAMVAWQTFMIGLQRPLYVLMFDGPDAYTSIGDVLDDVWAQFFPILGVTLLIGTVVYGGGLAGASAVVLPSVFGVVDWEPGLALLLGYFGVWIVACLGTGLFFGPATYFVATREIGVIGALTRSFSFVKQHLTEHLLAWVGFVAGSMLVGCLASVVSAFPGVGQLVQLGGSVFAGFLGLCYWASIYMMLEDDSDPSRSIVW